MKKLIVISLLSLMLIPLLLMNVNFLHNVVAHTHIFCASEDNHNHVLIKDCQTICKIAPTNKQNQIPVKVESNKFKQIVLTYPYLYFKSVFPISSSTSTSFSSFYGRIKSEYLFRPPMF